MQELSTRRGIILEGPLFGERAFSAQLKTSSLLVVLSLVCITCVGNGSTGSAQEASGAITETLLVLENTTAYFNWTHAFGGDSQNLYIKWKYASDELSNQQKDIMQLVPNLGIVKTNPARKDRISYVEHPGSAAMTLDSVDVQDAGIYSVEVCELDADSTITIITSTTCRHLPKITLKVIEVSALSYNIKIGNQTSSLPASGNGTVRLSPPLTGVQTGSQLLVEASVNSSAPAADIQIATDVSGQEHSELACENTHTCKRLVPMFERFVEYNKSTRIAISIHYHIQNLDTLKAEMPVYFEDSTSATSRKDCFNHVDVEEEKTDIYYYCVISLSVVYAFTVILFIVFIACRGRICGLIKFKRAEYCYRNEQYTEEITSNTTADTVVNVNDMGYPVGSGHSYGKHNEQLKEYATPLVSPISEAGPSTIESDISISQSTM